MLFQVVDGMDAESFIREEKIADAEDSGFFGRCHFVHHFSRSWAEAPRAAVLSPVFPRWWF